MPDNPNDSDYQNDNDELEGYIDNAGSSKTIHSDPVPVIGELGAIERDKKYTELLSRFSDNYNTSKKQMKNQKTAFFVVVLVFLGILLVSGIVLLFIALFSNSVNGIAIVIGASVDIFGTFIAIPTIMAKHLFPEKIDNDVIQVVKLLVENDKDIRLAKENRQHDSKKIK